MEIRQILRQRSEKRKKLKKELKKSGVKIISSLTRTSKLEDFVRAKKAGSNIKKYTPLTSRKEIQLDTEQNEKIQKQKDIARQKANVKKKLESQS